MKKTPFKMDPDVYDTLDGMARYFGGVGMGSLFTYSPKWNAIAPVCGMGFLDFAMVPTGTSKSVGFSASSWDVAVSRVLRRNPDRVTRDQYGIRRVPLNLVLKELNIVRGEG